MLAPIKGFFFKKKCCVAQLASFKCHNSLFLYLVITKYLPGQTGLANNEVKKNTKGQSKTFLGNVEQVAETADARFMLRLMRKNSAHFKQQHALQTV